MRNREIITVGTIHASACLFGKNITVASLSVSNQGGAYADNHADMINWLLNWNYLEDVMKK